MKLISSYFVLVISFCSCFELPTTFTKCDRKQSNFTDCLRNAISDAVKQLNKPFPEIGLSTLDPLEIPSLTFVMKTRSFNLQQKFTKINVYGHTDGSFSKAELDFSANTLSIEANFPKIIIDFKESEVTGEMLSLPVNKSGPGSIVYDGLNVTLDFSFAEYDKNNKKHFRISHVKLALIPGQLFYHFESLWAGGEDFDSKVAEQWKEFTLEMLSNCGKAHAQIFQIMFDNVLERFSISELFGDT